MASSQLHCLLHRFYSGSASVSLYSVSEPVLFTNSNLQSLGNGRRISPVILCCSGSSTNSAPPVLKKKRRYRRQYPGESNSITEEMRFVAMRLRNIKGKHPRKNNDSSSESEGIKEEEEKGGDNQLLSTSTSDGDVITDEEENWVPSMEGFLKYLVDSKLVFATIERIVDESSDVAYAYFRKTGLERSKSLSKDLEWFCQKNFTNPEPSPPGTSYARYLEELAEKSAPLFLCHFYNIYFAHVAGGSVIAKQVSGKLLQDREPEFCNWEGDVQEMLKSVREKINMLGEHWSRDEKNRCLSEAMKSFRYLGQIVRLNIL